MVARDELRAASVAMLERTTRLWEESLRFHYNLFPEEFNAVRDARRDWAAYMRMRRMREKDRRDELARQVNAGKTPIASPVAQMVDSFGVMGALLAGGDPVEFHPEEFSLEHIKDKAREIREKSLASGRLDLLAGIVNRKELILNVIALLYGAQEGFLLFEQTEDKKIWVIPC